MQTLRLFAGRFAALAADSASAQADLRIAADLLRKGGTVAFATETVYGLGANALDAQAVAKVFVAKQRPAWDPLIVHVSDESMLAQVAASLPASAQVLIERFWPGPLTLLVPRHPSLPDAVTAGRDKVGVRMPAHPVALALIRAAGVPVAAPSANTFGHVSPTSAAHVAADLDGRIDAILDSGETTLGLESTVVDTCQDPCMLYRPGAITLEQLREAWPAVEVYLDRPQSDADDDETDRAALASPGLGIRHYAPRARLVLVDGIDLQEGLVRALEYARAAGQSAGVMLPDEFGTASAGAAAVFEWGAWSDPSMLAQRLFSGLRSLDDQGVQVIVCPLPVAKGIGVAIVDRLRKAARRA
jgi:L-threonylcarbamoyladenylate synthase